MPPCIARGVVNRSEWLYFRMNTDCQTESAQVGLARGQASRRAEFRSPLPPPSLPEPFPACTGMYTPYPDCHQVLYFSRRRAAVRIIRPSGAGGERPVFNPCNHGRDIK